MPFASPGSVIGQARAARWAWVALRHVRRELPTLGLAVAVSPPPTNLPWAARGGIERMLNRSSATCLEKSLIRQCWLRSHARRHDLIIGVANVAGAFAAHAWLAGLPDIEDTTLFTEFVRRSPEGEISGLDGAQANLHRLAWLPD
jgi:hypothetical protein